MNNYFDLLPDELILIIFEKSKSDTLKLIHFGERYKILINLFYDNLNKGKFDPYIVLKKNDLYKYKLPYDKNIKHEINLDLHTNPQLTVNIVEHVRRSDTNSSYMKNTIIHKDNFKNILDLYSDNIEYFYYFNNVYLNNCWITDIAAKTKSGEYIYIELSKVLLNRDTNIIIKHEKNWQIFWNNFISDDIKTKILIYNGYLPNETDSYLSKLNLFNFIIPISIAILSLTLFAFYNRK
jgi:hypothetical protein